MITEIVATMNGCMMFYPQWSSSVTNQLVTDDSFCHRVSKRSPLSIVHAHTQAVIVPFSVQKVQQVACPSLHGKVKTKLTNQIRHPWYSLHLIGQFGFPSYSAMGQAT